MTEKHVYLSDSDNASLQSLRAQALELKEKGEVLSARLMNKYALHLINSAMISALEADIIPDDQSLMYTDIYGLGPYPTMTAEDFKKSARAIEINTLVGSPLHQDILALLKKHQEITHEDE